MGFDGAGYLLHQAFGVPLPSHVLGLLLLTAALFLRIVKLEWVENSASFLTKHMMLFFVPLLAGAAAIVPALGESWLAAAVGLTVGTSTIMVATGLATKHLANRRREKAADEG